MPIGTDVIKSWMPLALQYVMIAPYMSLRLTDWDFLITTGLLLDNLRSAGSKSSHSIHNIWAKITVPLQYQYVAYQFIGLVTHICLFGTKPSRVRFPIWHVSFNVCRYQGAYFSQSSMNFINDVISVLIMPFSNGIIRQTNFQIIIFIWLKHKNNGYTYDQTRSAIPGILSRYCRDKQIQPTSVDRIPGLISCLHQRMPLKTTANLKLYWYDQQPPSVQFRYIAITKVCSSLGCNLWTSIIGLYNGLLPNRRITSMN